MKKILNTTAIIILLSGCSKWKEDRKLAEPVVKAAQPISDAAPLCGAIKGTMLSGKTYTIGCDVVINKGDTLMIQAGVHINVKNKAGILPALKKLFYRYLKIYNYYQYPGFWVRILPPFAAISITL